MVDIGGQLQPLKWLKPHGAETQAWSGYSAADLSPINYQSKPATALQRMWLTSSGAGGRNSLKLVFQPSGNTAQDAAEQWAVEQSNSGKLTPTQQDIQYMTQHGAGNLPPDFQARVSQAPGGTSGSGLFGNDTLGLFGKLIAGATGAAFGGAGLQAF